MELKGGTTGSLDGSRSTPKKVTRRPNGQTRDGGNILSAERKAHLTIKKKSSGANNEERENRPGPPTDRKASQFEPNSAGSTTCGGELGNNGMDLFEFTWEIEIYVRDARGNMERERSDVGKNSTSHPYLAIEGEHGKPRSRAGRGSRAKGTFLIRRRYFIIRKRTENDVLGTANRGKWESGDS